MVFLRKKPNFVTDIYVRKRDNKMFTKPKKLHNI